MLPVFLCLRSIRILKTDFHKIEKYVFETHRFSSSYNN